VWDGIRQAGRGIASSCVPTSHSFIPCSIGVIAQVLDFVDPDIDARLEALEREEDAAAAAWEAQQVGALYCCGCEVVLRAGGATNDFACVCLVSCRLQLGSAVEGGAGSLQACLPPSHASLQTPAHSHAPHL
jgi:hypothetical protein